MGKGILLGLAISLLLLLGHFQSECLDQRWAGAIVTTKGVYCWRRYNDSFDDFKKLEHIQERNAAPFTPPVIVKPLNKVGL